MAFRFRFGSPYTWCARFSAPVIQADGGGVRASTIRARLVLLVLAAMIPTVLAAVAAILAFYAEEKQAFSARVLETTRAVSLVVDRELARREAIVRTLSESPTLTKNDLEGFYHYARRVAPTNDSAIILSDLGGRQLLNTRRPFGESNLPTTVFPPLRTDPLATVVSDLYFAPFGKQYSFALEAPVVRDGKVIYYVGMGSFASHLQKVLNDQRLPPSWIGSVIDRTGRIVARTTDPATIVGKTVTQDMLAQLASKSEGAFYTVSVDGRRVFAAFSKAQPYGWGVIIGVPVQELAFPARAVGRFAAVAAVLTLAAVAGAMWAARSILRPVTAIRQVAEDLGRGADIKATETGLAETDEVLRAMAVASASIQGAAEAMEQRVKEALAKAERAQTAVIQNQRLEAVGHLTGGIAHDFNNLMMVVGTNAHILRRLHRQGELDPQLAGIERAVAAGTRLTRQLLTFSRRQALRPEVLDLRTRLPALLELVQPAVGSAIAVRAEVAEGSMCIEIDPGELELALLNLAINAKDAMPGGGTLTVRVRREEGQQAGPAPSVLLEVEDTGRGIEPDVLERVFEPFFTTKPLGHGTGLGLSQVFGMCSQAGGSVVVESAPGRGTVVRMRFPVVSEALVSPEQSVEEADMQVNAAVLLAEDNPDVASAIREVLVSAGCQVRCVRTGDEALATLDSGELFSILLTDVRMPGRLSGVELATIAQQRHPRTAIVLMTGYTEELNMARSLTLPVLPKPCDARELLLAVRDAVQNRGNRGMSLLVTDKK
ncbi:ATP-binding protein [Aquabacterium sp. A7-Y]|uniref:hybrid sensor histidine kinase/response regulator n=1 Tax=Aquabacterium sp. A7-Y TaxID=1349605 RepID=UPI00223CB9B4|nr:ATP-binding protein [Aquabacterium sp. A7-Y]MCW7536694.1 ATP-binding protein [Aquabacterium sp. A7-Y]